MRKKHICKITVILALATNFLTFLTKKTTIPCNKKIIMLHLKNLLFMEKFNPQDFCDLLNRKKARQKNQELSDHEIDALIKKFASICWSLEKLQETCFCIFSEIILNVPQASYGFVAKRLTDLSINFPQFVLLANRIFEKIPPAHQKDIPIDPISWTDGEFALISDEEYRWRKKHNLSCPDNKKRPADLSDQRYFSISLDMATTSGALGADPDL